MFVSKKRGIVGEYFFKFAVTTVTNNKPLTS